MENNSSFALKSSRVFDRESISFYQIEIRARDFGQPSHRRSMTFDLNVTDLNDQRPFFPENSTFVVPENNRVPMQIGQVHALDLDEGPNAQLTYELVDSTNEFFISPHDGILWANVSFDYETKKFFRLVVKATDHGEPAFDASTFVEIRVENVNEFAPNFEQDVYRFSLEENSTKKFVGRVKAIDRDADDPLRYALQSDDDGLFQIDQNGQISTTKTFDREAKDQYQLTVIARDNSTASSATVIVQIK